MTATRVFATPLDAVDAVEVVSSSEVRATKRIVVDDPYLEGHYPDFTVYPGVFIIESVRHAVMALVARTQPDVGAVELTGVRSVRFAAPLLPGDTLLLTCRCEADGVTLSVKAIARDESNVKVAQLALDFRLDPVGVHA